MLHALPRPILSRHLRYCVEALRGGMPVIRAGLANGVYFVLPCGSATVLMRTRPARAGAIFYND